MAKTELTLKLEREIWEATHRKGVFCCFEVTIGFWGKERVDYITYGTKGIWRCYEIKVSKSDFHSKAHNTFIGHYNYYVMPQELYNEVKDEIPNYVGVYIDGQCEKRAKRQELGIDEQILKDSLIRSLYREAEKIIKSDNPTEIEKLTRSKNRYKKDADDYQRKYWELMRIGQEKYGMRWYKK
ncbi:MAG: hypothetical protein PHE29_08225 [Tissierellia bacterium]|nr:hypothetical protein [Tissierellia bacterium]MDD4779051.1 hypothetical protein [Tissierellia bacterium]